jgi:hypothetical protein
LIHERPSLMGTRLCLIQGRLGVAEDLTLERGEHLVEQLGRGGWLRLLGVWIWTRTRDGKGHGADATEEPTDEPSCFAVGDTGFAVFEEREKDFEDLVGNGAGFEEGNVAAKVDPAAETGIAQVFGEGPLGGRGGYGRVVAAEVLVTGGGAAALLAGGQDEAAFGGHGIFLLKAGSSNEKGRLSGGLSLFLPSIIRIPSLGNNSANFLWVGWFVSGVECWVITSVFAVGA